MVHICDDTEHRPYIDLKIVEAHNVKFTYVWYAIVLICIHVIVATNFLLVIQKMLNKTQKYKQNIT